MAVTTLDNKIYAVGGYNGATGLKSAESYDPELNIWQKVFQKNLSIIFFHANCKCFLLTCFFVSLPILYQLKLVSNVCIHSFLT